MRIPTPDSREWEQWVRVSAYYIYLDRLQQGANSCGADAETEAVWDWRRGEAQILARLHTGDVISEG